MIYSTYLITLITIIIFQVFLEVMALYYSDYFGNKNTDVNSEVIAFPNILKWY